MRKIYSDRHNTHDATDRNRPRGGVDRGHIYYTNSPDSTNRSIVFIRFFLSFALLHLLRGLRVQIPSDRSCLPAGQA